MGGVLGEMVANAEFRGRIHEVLPIPAQGKIKPRRVILYGLGALHDLDGQRLRSAHHELVRAARTWGYKRLAIMRAEPLGMDALKGVVEGAVMGTFERRSRQTGPAPERREIYEVILAGYGTGREAEVIAAQENGEATNRTREWQNAPANELTPDALAQEATRIAKRHNLEVEILGPSELKAGGYNLLLGVGAGSARPPRLIRIRYHGNHQTERADGRVLALIGKGITFDSGGISLKQPENMSRMKDDMSGGAAVLSAIDVIAARKLPLDVMAVIAAAENMPGPSAQRPGERADARAAQWGHAHDRPGDAHGRRDSRHRPRRERRRQQRRRVLGPRRARRARGRRPRVAAPDLRRLPRPAQQQDRRPAQRRVRGGRDDHGRHVHRRVRRSQALGAHRHRRLGLEHERRPEHRAARPERRRHTALHRAGGTDGRRRALNR